MRFAPLFPPDRPGVASVAPLRGSLEVDAAVDAPLYFVLSIRPCKDRSRPVPTKAKGNREDMKIVDYHGREISTLEEWERHFNSSKHWKKGRSAYSLADFILNRNGSVFLASRVSSVLSERVAFEWSTPEYKAKFDRYPNPSQLDLGIFGSIGSGSSLFVGVEAKVDEPFGSTVDVTYQKALEKQQRKKHSKAPERVEELLSKYFSESAPPNDSRFADIRYQLLTASAGTVAVSHDIAVLYVLVFKTESYAPTKGEGNYGDYMKFLDCAGGKPILCAGQASLAHELFLDGRRLVIFHEYVDLEN